MMDAFLDGIGARRLFRSKQDKLTDDDFASSEEISEMLNEVFGSPFDGGTVDEKDIATEGEITEMLDEVFGPAGKTL